MLTVKDLFTNDELMNSMVEDLEDLPEDTEVFYAVWAIGCDDVADPTGDEILIGEFADPDTAVACAEKVTFETLNEMTLQNNMYYGESKNSTVYFSIDVETVIGDPEDEDGGTMNIGTVYHRDLWLDGEYVYNKNIHK